MERKGAGRDGIGGSISAHYPVIPALVMIFLYAQAVLDRETREIERQQQRAMEMLQQEEAEIQAHLEYQAKMLEAKAADEKRQQVEIRRIENVYAGEMKKITQ